MNFAQANVYLFSFLVNYIAAVTKETVWSLYFKVWACLGLVEVLNYNNKRADRNLHTT